jgi:hypothetical protein
MANVIEMVPAQTLDENMKAAVLECTTRIRANKIMLRKAAMAIGYDGAVIESLAERGSWQFLGYHDQHDFRVSEGIGRSNWYRVVGVARLFLEVDRDVYIAMSMENAERLSVESPEIRLDPENLRRAAEMTAREFDDLMTTEGAHREGRPKSERWVEMKWRMQIRQREVIEAALKTWKEEHGLDDDAFALEMLVMEYADRPTLVSFILESIPRLTGAIRETTEIETLKEELTAYLQEMSDIVRVCCGETQEEESA